MKSEPLLISRRQIAAALALGLAAPWSRAAAWPDKPVTVVSPFAAGGTNDFLARLIAQHLGETLHATFVVDNRTGANGNVGASYIAKSPPDGYSLLMGNSATHGTNPTLYPDNSFDAIRDFTPVGMVGQVPIVMVTNAKLNLNTIADVVAYGKAHPGQLAFGSSGIGGTGHLCGEAVKAAAHVDMVHVPYKGDAPAVGDAMGGSVAIAFAGIASATGPAQSGRVRIIAVANPKRVASLPNVPTIAEAGYPGIVFAQWYALFARAGTSKAIVDQVNGAIKQVLAREDVLKALATQGAEPTYLTPAGLATFVDGEIVRFRQIIQRLDIKVS